MIGYPDRRSGFAAVGWIPPLPQILVVSAPTLSKHLTPMSLELHPAAVQFFTRKMCAVLEPRVPWALAESHANAARKSSAKQARALMFSPVEALPRQRSIAW
jgi:hypothetical protein